MKTEKVILLVVFKEGGQIKTEIPRDTHSYELYGFLNCWMAKLENELMCCISPREDKDDI